MTSPSEHAMRQREYLTMRKETHPLEFSEYIMFDSARPIHHGSVRLVDLAALAPEPPNVELWAVAPEHHTRPRVVRHRRRRSWGDVAGRAAWWLADRLPAAVVIALVCLFVYGMLREATL